MRIAIVKLGALGDVLRTTCLLRPLHRKYPGCEIWWYTLSSAVPLLKRNPLITRVVSVDPQHPIQDHTTPFDLVISLDEDALAARLASELSSNEILGVYSSANGKISYTPSSRAWFDMGILNRDPDGSLKTADTIKRANQKTYPQIYLEMMGLGIETKEDLKPVLFPDPAEEAWAKDFLSRLQHPKNTRIVAFNTGGGTEWPTKRMTVEKTVELINAVGRLSDSTLFLLGGPDEHERNAMIAARVQVPLIDTGTHHSLERFISLVNLCDTLITSDSMALHVATALGKQVIAFFGPTSHAEIELLNRGICWMPESPCGCFYKAHCTKNRFCLDALDNKKAIEQLRQWREARK